MFVYKHYCGEGAMAMSQWSFCEISVRESCLLLTVEFSRCLA